jgi:prostaglandin E receptor 4
MEFYFGVFGNFIAIIVLLINHHDHRLNSFYKLFIGLVITDFVGIVVVYPIASIKYASDFIWCFPENVCKFVSFMFVDADFSGALLISTISVDQFLYSVNNTLSDRTHIFILISIWIIAGLMSLLHLIGVVQINLYFPRSWCYFDFINDTTGNCIMSFLYSIFGFIIVFVTIVMYVMTMVRICKDPERRWNFQYSSILRILWFSRHGFHNCCYRVICCVVDSSLSRYKTLKGLDSLTYTIYVII